MKTALLILLLSSLLGILGAQGSPWQDEVSRSRTLLSAFPDDVSERLKLGYYLMLTGQAEEALREYRTVMAAEPGNADAAAGVLWALNTLGQWRQSLAEASAFLDKHPGSGLIAHYRAEALLRLGDPLRARRGFAMAEPGIGDSTLLYLPRQGLAWAYLAAGDHANSKRTARLARGNSQDVSLDLLQLKIKRLRPSLELSAGFKDSSGVSLGARAGIAKGSFSTRLGFEEYLLNGEHFRWAANLALNKQFRWLDLGLAAGYMDGEDSRVYQGISGSLSVSPRAYLGNLLARFVLAQHVSVYERFNLYQSDLGLSLNLDQGSLAYTYSSLYQDNEAIDADRQWGVQTLSASLRLFRGYYIGLYSGIGDLAWHINAQGAVVDDFEPVDSYLGASLYVPLSGALSLSLYFQQGYRDDEASRFFSLRVAYHA
jgi:hypothetical protein